MKDLSVHQLSAESNVMNKFFLMLIITTIFLFPLSAMGMVITADTTWSGDVTVDENILIPEGVTLKVLPGTTISVQPSEGTKTDPEFISFLTEILVRGRLMAEGSEKSPITFHSTSGVRSEWAGIIVDSGSAVLDSLVIRDAETGLDVISGTVALRRSLLTNNRYGLALNGDDALVSASGLQIKENDYGLLLLNGAELDSKDIVIKENRKKDTYSSTSKDHHPLLKEYEIKRKDKSTVYEDEVFLGQVVWQGRVEVNGIIRVPLNSRLVILPGTVVEFSKKDTNNDGIGENGLFIQGGFIAKGTEDEPIIFRSSEKEKGVSDWDSINILNSDRSQNLIEYCQIENAYRGLHFHFANVAVKDSVVRNNSRGIQFQESIVEISGTHFYDNNSALWARDSEVEFSDNLIYRNYSGINFFRNTLSVRDNLIMNNGWGGLRVREGIPVVERNLIDGNRYGLLVVDAVYGTFSRNVISHNLESGIALRGPVNIEISENIIQENGLYGISIQDSSAVIRGNHIADNDERGIGVLSFHGVITGNNIVRNGLYDLGIDGEGDVSAAFNWWGDRDVREGIYDNEDDPSAGSAVYLPILEEQAEMKWPLRTINADTTWRDEIIVEEEVTVGNGIDFALLPGARVHFLKDAGLVVKGRVLAKGGPEEPVVFSSYDDEVRWGEIRLEHADGSLFSNCIIRNAEWGLHIHFTDMKVEGCSFDNNYGGLRFRSGPVEISRSIFKGNEIGLRSHMGVGLLRDSIMTENRIGIFIKTKGSGLRISKNNIFSNSGYNIRVGDFNDEDVDARENWWGTIKPGKTIFDEKDEPGIGAVRYEPFSKKPFLLELPLWINTENAGRRDEDPI